MPPIHGRVNLSREYIAAENAIHQDFADQQNKQNKQNALTTSTYDNIRMKRRDVGKFSLASSLVNYFDNLRRSRQAQSASSTSSESPTATTQLVTPLVPPPVELDRGGDTGVDTPGGDRENSGG